VLVAFVLRLPAYMSAPRKPAADVLITAHDPNYASYLRVMASIGPGAPRPLAAASRVRIARPFSHTGVAPPARTQEDGAWGEPGRDEPGAQPDLWRDRQGQGPIFIRADDGPYDSRWRHYGPPSEIAGAYGPRDAVGSPTPAYEAGYRPDGPVIIYVGGYPFYR